MLIVSGEQEEASTLDALEKHMFAKGWKMNSERVRRPGTPVSFYGSSGIRHVHRSSKHYKQVTAPSTCSHKEKTFWMLQATYTIHEHASLAGNTQQAHGFEWCPEQEKTL